MALHHSCRLLRRSSRSLWHHRLQRTTANGRAGMVGGLSLPRHPLLLPLRRRSPLAPWQPRSAPAVKRLEMRVGARVQIGAATELHILQFSRHPFACRAHVLARYGCSRPLCVVN